MLNCVISIDTVSQLDLTKYQGRWYQIYGDKFDQLFQHNGKCVTADYTLVPNANVSILNSQYSMFNELEQYVGYAYYKNEVNSKFNPGELTVHLEGVPYDAPYSVVNLGPEVSGLYDWAIVTDPAKLSLFVLTRDVERFYSNYNIEVLSLLDDYGFDSVIAIQHNNCRYVPGLAYIPDNYSKLNLGSNVQS
jgi:lipocalin